MGFPGGIEVENLPVTQEPQEMWVPSLGRQDPGRRKWQPTPVFLPGKSHGQSSLVGYSPQGRKQSDTPEHAHMPSVSNTLVHVTG